MFGLRFHTRYYTLSADGKLYSAKDDQTTTRKHMLGLGESSTFELARKTDLIVKGHSTEESEEFVNEFLHYHIYIRLVVSLFSTMEFSCLTILSITHL